MLSGILKQLQEEITLRIMFNRPNPVRAGKRLPNFVLIFYDDPGYS